MALHADETTQETAEALFGPNAADLKYTPARVAAFQGRREEVMALRREAEEAAANQPPSDPLAERKEQAAALRRDREAREALLADAKELVAAEYGDTLGDVSDLPDAEILGLAFPSNEPTDADLTHDLEANLAAAERPTKSWLDDANARIQKKIDAEGWRQNSGDSKGDS